jgi:HD-GYP domain-containing protein (c-di-GMP phosphodiesterase class II)
VVLHVTNSPKEERLCLKWLLCLVATITSTQAVFTHGRNSLDNHLKETDLSTTESNQQTQTGEILVDVSQLRVGVHVHLPNSSWLSHGLLFNSFVISTQEQIKKIIAMQPTEIYCDLKRCKLTPLPIENTPAPSLLSAAQEQKKSLKEQLLLEKKAFTKKQLQLRKRINQAEMAHTEEARIIGIALKYFNDKPRDTIKQAHIISERSTATLLANTRGTITLVNEKNPHLDHLATHALSVMTLSLLLGKQAGLSEEGLHAIGIGALLHDIGKQTFHSSILTSVIRNKFEEEVYRTHCRIGYENALHSGAVPPAVLDIILHHHERIDGSGFPDQLQGEAITLGARVVGIADHFDTLTNPANSSLALSPSEALAFMWVKERIYFDNLLLQHFIHAMGVYPPGSIVKLSNGHIGTITTSASVNHPLLPNVLEYIPGVPRAEAIITDLTKNPTIKIEKPLHFSECSEEQLEYLLPKRKISWFISEEN